MKDFCFYDQRREEEEEKGKGSTIDGSKDFFLERHLSKKTSFFNAKQPNRCGDENESSDRQTERQRERIGKEN